MGKRKVSRDGYRSMVDCIIRDMIGKGSYPGEVFSLKPTIIGIVLEVKHTGKGESTRQWQKPDSRRA